MSSNQTGGVASIAEFRSRKQTQTAPQDVVEADLVARVEIIEKKLERDSPEHRRDESIPPERLYAEISDQPTIPIVIRVREILSRSISHLDGALANYDEELERENSIELAIGTFHQLDRLSDLSTLFQDAVTLVQMAAANHRTVPYSKKEIVALKTNLLTIRGNVRMKSEVLDKCMDTFMNAGFDLSGSLARIDLNDFV